MGLEGRHEVEDAAAGHVRNVRVVVEIAFELYAMPIDISRHSADLNIRRKGLVIRSDDV